MLQVALGIVVFGENDNAQVVPLCARLAQIRAHMLANPVEQGTDATIGLGACAFGYIRHLVEEILLAREYLVGLRVVIR